LIKAYIYLFVLPAGCKKAAMELANSKLDYAAVQIIKLVCK